MKAKKFKFLIVSFIFTISVFFVKDKSISEIDKLLNIDKSTIILKNKIIDTSIYNQITVKTVVNIYEYKNYAKDSIYPEEHYIEIIAYKKQKKNWIQISKFIEVIDCSNSREPNITDFNFDGYKDIIIKYCSGARGANTFNIIYLFNKDLNNYNEITNSLNYSNIYYNKFMKCYASEAYSGGYDYSLLKLQDNTLRQFAGVHNYFTEDEKCFVREVYLKTENEEYLKMQIDTIKDIDLFFGDYTDDSLIFQYLKK